LKENIKEDKAAKKTDQGQVNKWKKTLMGASRTSWRRRKNRLVKPLKCGLCEPRVLVPRVLVPRVLAPRVLAPRVLVLRLRSRDSKSHGMINRGIEDLRGLLWIERLRCESVMS
jgi:hypothetical protein